MQKRFGFTDGMRQSISPNKADPQSYYEALNKRIVVDSKSGTSALTDEPGTRLLVTIPSTKPVYKLFVNKDVPVNGSVTFSTDLGNITIVLNGFPSVKYLYSVLKANTNLDLLVNANILYYGMSGDDLVIVYLNDSVAGLSVSGTGIYIDTVVPEITSSTIIATASVRNLLILFTKSGEYGQIWKCKYDELGNIPALSPSENLVYNNVLYPDNLDYQIYDVVSRWDNKELIKIYWSDTVNELYHLNIASQDSLVIPLKLLSVTPDVSLTQPKISGIGYGGLYNSGMVQYGYQLYNLNGSETVISPLSGLVHLTQSSSNASTSISYKGTENGENTGKAITVTVPNIDSSYEFIKIIAVYYTSEEGEPEINVVYEGKVPEVRYVTIVDGGDTVLSVYTPAQLNSIGTRIFSPKLLTTKDNYLIAGNYIDKYFDIDEELGFYWDARTYRFDSGVDNKSKIKFVGDSFYTQLDTNFKISGEDIPETHDCYLEKDEQYAFKYQTNGVRLGGSGPKISYAFFTRPLLIDDLSEDKHIVTPTVQGNRQKWGNPGTIDFIEDTYSNNFGFTNYASPINQAEVVGYQRDEVYRFGIVFFDNKGRQSFVKWIGDIKMPTSKDIDSIPYYYENQVTQASPISAPTIFFKCTGGSGIYANALGISFSVDTSDLPDDWKYAIVRVRREDVDKTIIAQGTPIMGWNNPYYNFIQPTYRYDEFTLNYYDLSPGSYRGMLYFYSPEFKFGKSFNRFSNDYIEFLSTFTPDMYQIPSGDAGEFSKFYKVDNPSTIGSTITRVVQDSIFTDVNSDINYTVENIGAVKRASNYGWGIPGGLEDDKMCYIGSNLLLGLEDDSVLGLTGQAIINYKRDLITQYGGFSYINKQNNTYILAGKLRSCAGNMSFSQVYGGDTFIECYDFLHTMLDSKNNINHDNYKHKSVIYLPVESSINLALRHDTCPSKYPFAAESSKLQETVEKGFQVWPGDDTYLGGYPSNLTDLYLYNSVYSKQSTGKFYVAKPFNFKANTINDCSATSSEKNIPGELTDSWTKFLFNNFIKVNSANGPLSKLHVFRNSVLFWQDKAFGQFSFNDRKVLTDSNGSQLILGIGSVLEYFQYISEMSGTKFTRSVVDSGAAVYWYDDTNHKMMMSQGGKEESISDIADVAPLFKKPEFDNPYDVIGAFDKSTRRVLLTVKADIIPGVPEITEHEIKYGALYNWYAATDERNITSAGDFVVPGEAEIYTFHNYLSDNYSPDPANKIKDADPTYWNNIIGGTNDLGFNARGSGTRYHYNGEFSRLNDLFQFGSTYIIDTGYSIMWVGGEMQSNFSGLANVYIGDINSGNSIRLMRLATEAEQLLDDGTYCDPYVGNDGKIYRTVKIGTQVWTAENLAETKFRNGDWIHGFDGGVYTPISNEDWAALTSDGMCFYDDEETNYTETIVTPAIPASYSGLTISFNERLQAFESIYSYVPKIWAIHDGELLGVGYLNYTELHEFNNEEVPNKFFNQPAEEGYISIVAGGDELKVFTNVEFNSVAKSTTSEYPLVTVDNMVLENAYNTSAKLPLTPSNLRRRFRTWRIQLPKDKEGVRYLDSYLKLTLFNTPSNDANLRIEDISIYYLIPML